jgi:L-alanine-DL-glutamate epimerase-like enolase superfamily enzyme
VPATPDVLGRALGALPVVIDEASAHVGAVAVTSYGDEPRPHSVVRLAGRGAVGRGEHVGWSVTAHEACSDASLPRIPRGVWRLDAWSAALAHAVSDPYDRAAAEAAAIDLALRQRGTTLFALADRPPRPLRYVVSFARVADPAAEARRQGDVELKVDADPAWDDATFAALAAAGRVAVLDWKGGGMRRDHERAHRLLPDALVEDPCWDAAPWSANLTRRVSADAPVQCAADVDRLPVTPAAVNLKPARLGGVFELLAAAAACATRGIAVYLGGMFELDVGRRQLQALAALLSPDGPNDVAPISRAGAHADRPDRLVPDGRTPGFGP